MRLKTGSTVTIAATAASASVALSATPGTASAVLVTNAGPNVAFVKFGVGSQTAATTDLPILPYTSVLLDVGSTPTYAGAICAATQTAAVYFTIAHEVNI